MEHCAAAASVAVASTPAKPTGSRIDEGAGGTGTEYRTGAGAGSSRSGGGQPDDRLEAAAGRVEELDRAAVDLDEPPGDREPEARSAAARARPPEAVEGARLLLRRSFPGPRRPRAARRGERPAPIEMRTTEPPGAWRRAFETRLSITWATRSAPARAVGRRPARAAGARRLLRPGARPRVAPRLRRRGRPARPASSRRRRGQGRAARRRGPRVARPRLLPPRGCPRPSSPTWRSRFSSRSRSAVSGVRSSWEASATNSRCTETSPSTRATMSLNSSASRRSSGGASGTGARAERSPAPAAAAASSTPCERAPDPAGEAEADQRRRREHDRRRSRRARASSCERAGRARRSDT